MKTSPDLTAFFDLLPVSQVLFGSDGHIQAVNQAWVRFLGYSPAESCGRRIFDFLTPASTALLQERLLHFGTTSTIQGLEIELRHKNGTLVQAEFMGAFRRDQRATTEVEGIGIFYDLVERKRMESLVRENEIRYRRMVDAVTDYTFRVLIEQGRPIKTIHSPTCLAVTGYTPEEFATDPHLWIRMVHDDDKAAVREQAERMLKGLDVKRIEHRIIRKDGTLRWVSSVIAPHFDAAGKVASYDGLIRDITDRKKAEEALIAARDAAEAANKAKTDFLSTVSHEIRTPLNGILGFSRLLKLQVDQLDGSTSSEIRRQLSLVEKCGHTLLAIVGDILDLSKIETGRLEMIRQPFSPFVLFMETTETFRLSATEKGLELNLEIGDMPEFVVGDPKRLKQVLFNIISNAIKYTEKGSILLRADRVRGGILVEVTDTGIGIPKEALQKVFTPFFRVDQAMARRQDGSGLGLAIVKGILSALGGNIMIESHVGRGTTVMFHYPIMLEEDSSEEVAAVVSRIAANRNLKGLKALIVEDDPDSAAYLQTCLDMHGITHKHIPDADELNKLCAQIKPDLIFLDLYLPHRDGFVALRSLRENSALACKVIAQTADAFEETREHCRRAGFDGYLAKPYSPEDLLQEIRRVLGTPAIP